MCFSLVVVVCFVVRVTVFHSSCRPPLRALFLITTKGIPPLKDGAKWSAPLKEFTSQALIKKVEDRPDAAKLLAHPFLKTACKKDELVPIIEQAKQLKRAKEYK